MLFILESQNLQHLKNCLSLNWNIVLHEKSLYWGNTCVFCGYTKYQLAWKLIWIVVAQTSLPMPASKTQSVHPHLSFLMTFSKSSWYNCLICILCITTICKLHFFNPNEGFSKDWARNCSLNTWHKCYFVILNCLDCLSSELGRGMGLCCMYFVSKYTTISSEISF